MCRLTPETADQIASQFLAAISDSGEYGVGRGIVICAGGIKYNTCAWVLIKLLRELGCDLPIEVWYLGPRERDHTWIELVRPLNVTCIDARVEAKRFPHRRLAGWPLKPYAILHSRFQEVLFLDADNVPVRNPVFLFDASQYQETGTVFWPDPEKFHTPPDSPRWKVFGTPYRDSPDQESGQLLVNKARCWRALELCNWYNEYSDFYYQFVYGDKETFRFAWQRLEQPISWIPTFADESVLFTLRQHDFEGDVLFQHRFYHKWSLYEDNPFVEGFQHYDKCLGYIEELRQLWSPVEQLTRRVAASDRKLMREVARRVYLLEMVGQTRWPMRLAADGHITHGFNRTARFWWVRRGLLNIAGSDGRLTGRFRPAGDGWQSRSRRDRRRLMRLVPMHGGPEGQHRF